MPQLLLRVSRTVNRHVVKGLHGRGHSDLRPSATTLPSNIELSGHASMFTLASAPQARHVTNSERTPMRRIVPKVPGELVAGWSRRQGYAGGAGRQGELAGFRVQHCFLRQIHSKT